MKKEAAIVFGDLSNSNALSAFQKVLDDRDREVSIQAQQEIERCHSQVNCGRYEERLQVQRNPLSQQTRTGRVRGLSWLAVPMLLYVNRCVRDPKLPPSCFRLSRR